MHALCAGQCDRRGSAGRLIPELADPDSCYVRPTPEQAALREGVMERRAHAVTSICQHTAEAHTGRDLQRRSDNDWQAARTARLCAQGGG